MHSESDLPHFLREGWAFSKEETPNVGKVVQVRTPTGRVTSASYHRYEQEDGSAVVEWVETILGVAQGSIQVEAWRRPDYVSYTFSWDHSASLVGEPKHVASWPYLFSGDDLQYKEGESVTVTTGFGVEWAREVARIFLRGFFE